VRLLDLAQFYVREPGDLPARDGALLGRTVANSSSSRAPAPRLVRTRGDPAGADVVNLDLHSRRA